MTAMRGRIAYRTTHLEGLDQGYQVLAVYDQAIHMARAAAARLAGREAGDVLGPLREASACVAALQEALDFLRGEEVAVNLWRLYEFVRTSLERAWEEGDAEAAEDALFVLESLRDGWRRWTREAAGATGPVVCTYREPVCEAVIC
ncbi:MAG: hypothetical protein D6739_03790 [Nitrospirae bacterium]|nr:MAG: hypothetical protein D6739_03790 [Nitrospirota bacterium]